MGLTDQCILPIWHCFVPSKIKQILNRKLWTWSIQIMPCIWEVTCLNLTKSKTSRRLVRIAMGSKISNILKDERSLTPKECFFFFYLLFLFFFSITVNYNSIPNKLGTPKNDKAKTSETTLWSQFPTSHQQRNNGRSSNPIWRDNDSPLKLENEN